MRTLFVTSECASFKKFGGLGDYSYSLPVALNKLGIEVDVILPYYSDIVVTRSNVYKLSDLVIPYKNSSHTVSFFKTKFPNSDISVVLVKIPVDFGAADFLNSIEYYVFFNVCVVEYIKSQYNIYDLIHLNDWHTGFIPHLLEEIGTEKPKTIFTIHNLAYQGIQKPDVMKDLGLVPGQHSLLDWDMKDGDINMIFQGITSSDYVVTVSPSYAQELSTKEFGGEFADYIRERGARFKGILNGIDYTTLPRSYNLLDWKEGKAENKKVLRKKLKLDETSRPIFSFISRLDPGQKGLDVLYPNISYIVGNGGQFILLGTGDPVWEEKFQKLGTNENISINIKFDNELANLIYAGSDFFMVPSKYEPCGLTQMMSMWYGTLPIVHAVGGLKDTVFNHVNGFTFDDYTKESLQRTIEVAFETYSDSNLYAQMVTNAMQHDYSWDKSALVYKNLYEEIVYG